MSSFFSKIRTLTLGAAHDLVDTAIDMNSPSAVRQYVRDLEAALDKMRSESAIQAGQVRTLTREIGDLEHNIESGKALIASRQSAGKIDAARAKASEVLNWQKTLEQKRLSLEAQKKTSEALDASVTRIEARHAEMVNAVRELERLDRDSKAKEAAAAAMTSASKLVSGGADISNDDVSSRMHQRNDVAEEKFQRAMGGLETDENPEHEAAIDDLLSSLK